MTLNDLENYSLNVTAYMYYMYPPCSKRQSVLVYGLAYESWGILGQVRWKKKQNDLEHVDVKCTAYKLLLIGRISGLIRWISGPIRRISFWADQTDIRADQTDIQADQMNIGAFFGYIWSGTSTLLTVNLTSPDDECFLTIRRSRHRGSILHV